MSIQREEITIKNFISGTTLTFFSTHLSSNTTAIKKDPTIEYVPTIVWLNNYNVPYRVSTFDGQRLWALNSDNNYQPIEELADNYITGHCYVKDFSYIIDENRLKSFKSRFSAQIDVSLSTGSTTVSSYGVTVETPTFPEHVDFVFASNHEIDDFYVNIKLNRTYGTLDTLNVYNNLVNSVPTQEANTGVVFGRLMALQSIVDIEGNKIKIPLRNVPIGIFNPSVDYPTSTSVDDNGDRLFLNLKENSTSDEYFNIESFDSDSGYLRSASQFTTVPDQYKLVTTTNENGEFIIYDAPIGTQIVVFEVDLFKQGLTKDEIALNFFPFPASNESILDTIPNFSFKQIPVDVLPAWGTTQTGYTELEITVNYDLRKWATYYVPPMAYDGNLLGSSELFNFFPTLNVDIRDMSKEGFPIKTIPVVEIQNIYDKDTDQTLLWDGEFAQLKKTAKFFEHGFRAFKVRANMYDPKGFRTDSDGTPRTHPTSQGVWLAGYEFKLYYNQPSSIFRTTGFQRDWGFTTPGGWVGRDHFHLNRESQSNVQNSSVGPLTTPPYDRPWDYLYPNKYKIPAKPTQLNFVRSNNSTRLPGTYPFYLEQPEYKDGDLVGLPVSAPSVYSGPSDGGYGVQYSSANNYWFANRFSKEVTASYIYKYEGGVAWNEVYANGFEPSNPSFPVDPNSSHVINGEKYQRVECGYGYWLRPGGWPPVSAEPWGDTIFSRSTIPGDGLSSTSGPGVLNVGSTNGNIIVQAQDLYIDIYNIEDKDIALALDDNATFSEGPLDIYRIIDPKNRIDRGPEVVPTSAVFKFQNLYFQRGGNSQRIQTAIKNGGSNDKEEFFSRAVGGVHGNFDYQVLSIKIQNNGSINVTIPGTSVELEPGGSEEFTAIELGLDNLVIELPGNSNFDFGTSKYLKANYSMKFTNVRHLKDDGTPWSNASQSAPYEISISNTNVDAETVAPDYWLITRYLNLRTQYDGDDLVCENGNTGSGNVGGTNSKWEHNVKMNGALFKTPNTNNNGSIVDIMFWDEPITPTCGGGFDYNDGVQSIGIEVY